MSLSAFRRTGFAAWLVAVALIANAAAQNQLAVNVVEAAAERVAPPAPADPHAHHRHHAQAAPVATPAHAGHDHNAPGGHTHKGHADCAVCGVVATMAALTLPAPVAFDVPTELVLSTDSRCANFARCAARFALYISRAPPVLT